MRRPTTTLIFSTILWASLVQATVTLESVTGASSAVKSTTDSSWTIYGGNQGANYSVACSGASNTTCNTCVGPTTFNSNVSDGPCNPAGVFGDTVMTFNATTTAAEVSGGKWLLCAGSNEVGLPNNSTGKSVARQVVWGNICSDTNAGGTSGNSSCGTAFTSGSLVLGYGTSCSTLGEEKVSILILSRHVDVGVSSTYTQCSGQNGTGGYGACSFALFPGDKKVYIESSEFYVDSSFPAVSGGPSGITYDNIWFFFLEVPTGANDGDIYQNITNSTDSMSNSFVPIESNGEALAGSMIDGLDNDIRYCFRMASQDKAKNIDMFTPLTTCAAGTAKCDKVCMTPSEVVGLLTDKKCFIATAAFGSEMDEHVQMLRDFRNKFMAPFWVGRKLVKAYYTVSPYLARWIAQHETARTVTRGALWPLLGWAELSLKWGWPVVVAPFLIFVLAIFALRRRDFKRGFKKA